MNSLKDHVRKAHPTINHFLTYADNYAVGYFKKQGFTKEITLEREKWVGYIKDYEGGTIMQCTMLPKVRYLDVHQMLADQKAVSATKRALNDARNWNRLIGGGTGYTRQDQVFDEVAYRSPGPAGVQG
jgi:hypothetical protein